MFKIENRVWERPRPDHIASAITGMINEDRIAFGKRLRRGATTAKHLQREQGANAVRGLHIRAALRTDCGGA